MPTATAPLPATGPATQMAGGSYGELSPGELSGALATKDFTLINAHVPDDGEIAGTDAFIPYDRIGEDTARLPGDRALLPHRPDERRGRDDARPARVSQCQPPGRGHGSLAGRGIPDSRTPATLRREHRVSVPTHRCGCDDRWGPRGVSRDDAVRILGAGAAGSRHMAVGVGPRRYPRRTTRGVRSGRS